MLPKAWRTMNKQRDYWPDNLLRDGLINAIRYSPFTLLQSCFFKCAFEVRIGFTAVVKFRGLYQWGCRKVKKYFKITDRIAAFWTDSTSCLINWLASEPFWCFHLQQTQNYTKWNKNEEQRHMNSAATSICLSSFGVMNQQPLESRTKGPKFLSPLEK